MDTSIRLWYFTSFKCLSFYVDTILSDPFIDSIFFCCCCFYAVLMVIFLNYYMHLFKICVLCAWLVNKQITSIPEVNHKRKYAWVAEQFQSFHRKNIERRSLFDTTKIFLEKLVLSVQLQYLQQCKMNLIMNGLETKATTSWIVTSFSASAKCYNKIDLPIALVLCFNLPGKETCLMAYQETSG